MDYNREPLEIISPNSYEDAKTFLLFQGRRSALFGYVLLVFSIGSGLFNIMTVGFNSNQIWVLVAVALAVFNIAMAKGLHFSRKSYERTHSQIAKGFRYLFRNDEVILINLLTVGDQDWKPIYKQTFADNQPPTEIPESAETKESSEADPATPPTLPEGWNILNYSSIVKIVEADTAFYLYINRNAALILIKDNFTKEKLNEFEALMEDKLSSRFQPLGSKK